MADLSTLHRFDDLAWRRYLDLAGTPDADPRDFPSPIDGAAFSAAVERIADLVSREVLHRCHVHLTAHEDFDWWVTGYELSIVLDPAGEPVVITQPWRPLDELLLPTVGADGPRPFDVAGAAAHASGPTAFAAVHRGLLLQADALVRRVASFGQAA